MKSITDFYNESIKKCWEPPPRLTVSQWADSKRMLSKEGSAEPGQWHTDRAPYQREIMDAVTQPDIEKVVVMSSSQVGKSEILNNIIGYFIDLDPCPMLLIEPTDMMAEDYSKRRIAPLIRDTPCLADKVSDSRAKDTNNTILMKSFPGGSLGMVGANSPSGLASRPIRILLCDEVDRYPPSAGTEGDPVKLAEKRTITFWNRKEVFVSSPGIKGASRIEDEFLLGTQEQWRLQCPSCGEYVFPNLFDMIYESGKDDKGNYSVHNIFFRCPNCKKDFDERTWKAQPGNWVATNPGAKGTRSFHMNAFVSPWYSWQKIIEEYLTTKDDPEQFIVFTNTVLGETFEVKGEIENDEFLLDRCEDYGSADLPDGVLFLTAAVDVQDSWLEYEIVGWGKEEESWGIKHGQIPGSPTKPEVWEHLSEILFATYYFADGIGQKISCTFVDSGYCTSEVYDYCKANRSKNVFAIKGQGGNGYPLIYKIAKTREKHNILIILGVDDGKAAVMDSLKVKRPGPFFCHFPKRTDYDAPYFKGLISERRVVRKRSGITSLCWEKVSPSARNEPFDIRNYAHAAFKLANPNLNNFELYLKRTRGEPVSEPVKQQPDNRPRVIHNRYL